MSSGGHDQVEEKIKGVGEFTKMPSLLSFFYFFVPSCLGIDTARLVRIPNSKSESLIHLLIDHSYGKV